MVERIGEGREPLQPPSTLHLCQALSVSRAAYYRWETADAAIARGSLHCHIFNRRCAAPYTERG